MPFSQYLTATGQTLAATTPPPVPTGLTALPGSDRVTLHWTDSTEATGYVVEMRISGGIWGNVYSGTAMQITQSGLVPETDYEFRVKAASTTGESDWVEIVTRTKTSQRRNRIMRFTTFTGATPSLGNVIKGG